MLTAILLHELGHCFNYTSNFPNIFLSVMRWVFNIIGIFPKMIVLPLIGLGWFYALTITVTAFVVCRSLTFLEHLGEYKADQFVVRYGYGDELAKFFDLIHKEDLRQQHHTSWIKKALVRLFRFFIPSSHPDIDKRIEHVANDVMNEYKKLYPEIEEELTIILSDMKRGLK